MAHPAVLPAAALPLTGPSKPATYRLEHESRDQASPRPREPDRDHTSVRQSMVIFIVAAQICIFIFDVATSWDDVAIGFLYIVPTLMSFFIHNNRLRTVVVVSSILFIGLGGIFPLAPEYSLGIDLFAWMPGLVSWLIASSPWADAGAIDEGMVMALTGRAWALITVAITGIIIYYRLRLEQTLSAALSKEQRASSLQRAFVSMVSHEFRTPLTIIDGEAYRINKLKETITPENLEKRAKTIRTAVTRLVNLIEKILYTSRAFDNKIVMKVGRVNLWNLLRSICYQHSQVSASHKIIFNIYDIPVSIKGDVDLLTYVFDNLIGNAIKYSPSGSEIEVSGTAEHSKAVISIRDQGIGIPKDDLTNLFEPYYRGSNVGGISGSGVGLYLVRSFVLMHGGRIEVESEVGKGSTFTVHLPISAAELPRAADG